MRKTIVALGLVGVFAAAVVSSPASAGPTIPLPKSAISSLSGVTDVGWRRCWRNRWGQRVCQWCWRNRWGHVVCN